MNDWLGVFLAGIVTMLATGLGAIPVYLLGSRAGHWRPFLVGIATGAMSVAAVAGLLIPGLDLGSAGAVAGGALVGIALLVLVRGALHRRGTEVEALRGADLRRAMLIFGVLFAHSLPEGFAVGTAYAAPDRDISIFVIVAIALQNIPEGTAVAIPMNDAGLSRSRQFWVATATSLPQPFGAVIAFALVDQVTSLLPASFGFAAGAMLALVALELVPDGFRRGTSKLASLGALAGAALMLALDVAIGV